MFYQQNYLYLLVLTKDDLFIVYIKQNGPDFQIEQTQKLEQNQLRYQQFKFKEGFSFYMIVFQEYAYLVDKKSRKSQIIYEVIDFIEVDQFIYLLYNDRFEIWDRNSDSKQIVYLKQLIIYNDYSQEFIYNFIDDQLIIRLQQKIVIIKNENQKFNMINILQFNGLEKIAIQRNILHIYLSTNKLILYDLYKLHELDIKDLYFFGRNDIQKLRYYYIEMDHRINNLIFRLGSKLMYSYQFQQNYLLIQGLKEDQFYMLNCRYKRLDQIVMEQFSVELKIKVLKYQYEIMPHQEKEYNILVNHNYILNLDNYLRGNYMEYTVDYDSIINNNKYISHIINGDNDIQFQQVVQKTILKTVQSQFKIQQTIFQNSIFVTQFVIQQRILLFIQYKNFQLQVYYCDLQLTKCQVHQKHSTFYSKILKLRLIVNHKNMSMFSQFNILSDYDEQIVQKIKKYCYFGILFEIQKGRIHIFDLQGSEKSINIIEIDGFNQQIDEIMDFQQTYLDQKSQLLVIQQLNRQVFTVDVLSSNKHKNHIIDIKFLQQFDSSIDFFQPCKIEQSLNNQNYFLIQDRISIYILEYFQIDNKFRLVNRIKDQMTHFRGFSNNFDMLLFFDQIAVMNTNFKTIRFYDIQNMEKVLPIISRPLEIGSVDRYFYSKKNGILILIDNQKMYIKNTNQFINFNFQQFDIELVYSNGYLQDWSDNQVRLFIYNSEMIKMYQIFKEPLLQFKVVSNIPMNDRYARNIREMKTNNQVILLIKGYQIKDSQFICYSRNQTLNIFYINTQIRKITSSREIRMQRNHDFISIYPLDLFQGSYLNFNINCINCLNKKYIYQQNKEIKTLFKTSDNHIVSYIYTKYQILVLDQEKNIYIIENYKLKKSISVMQNYKVEIFNNMLFIFDYENKDFKYLDFNLMRFVRSNLIQFEQNFFDIIYRDNTCYIFYRLNNNLQMISKSLKDQLDEPINMVIPNSIDEQGTVNMDFFHSQDHILLIYQNKKFIKNVVVRFQNKKKQKLEFDVDLNQLLEYHAYQQSFKIVGLRVYQVNNSEQQMDLQFLVIFQEFQSYLIHVQYVYDLQKQQNSILGCFNRFDSNFIVSQFERLDKHLSMVSYFNNRLILSVYDINYCQKIFRLNNICVYANFSNIFSSYSQQKTKIYFKDDSTVLLNIDKELVQLQQMGFNKIDNFDSLQDLELNVTLTGINQPDVSYELVLKKQHADNNIFSQFWVVYVIIVLIISGFSVSYFLIKKKRKDRKIQMKFLI